MVGRNDLCPCGSGKKYKKCCGKNTVVSMDLLIEKDLYQAQLDILHYAQKEYGQEMDDLLNESLKEFDIPNDAVELFKFFGMLWYITTVDVGYQTIMEEFIEENILQYNRPRVRDILESWAAAYPSVYIIQELGENQYFTVQDIFTREVQKVKALDEESAAEVGGIILGTVLPAGATSVFFTTFLDFPASEVAKKEEMLLDLYHNFGEDEGTFEFMKALFLDVLDQFMFGEDITIDDLQWDSQSYKDAVISYQEYMESRQYNQTAINLGIYLWNTYCLIKKPTIQKTAIYAAALAYLVDKIIPYGGFFTQKELAEDFGVSSGSISSKYKDLDEVLADKIAELNEEVFNEFDEFDEEDEDGGFDVEDFHSKSRLTMERELLKLENNMMKNDSSNPKARKGNLSNKEKAQELIFEAFEAVGYKRQYLAKKALKLYPNSPDAYNILAEDIEDDPEGQIELYQLAMKAGEQELGPAFFEENKGDFWGIVSTRPYMRAKLNYAMLMHELGDVEEAITHYEELLELNQMDNQAVRYSLFIAYVEEGLLEKAESLLNQFNEDITAHGSYNQTLIEYLKNGPSPKAKKLLKKAKNNNPYVIDFLTRKKKLPGTEPYTYMLGDESEAIVYAEAHIHLWQEDPKLIEWLKGV